MSKSNMSIEIKDGKEAFGPGDSMDGSVTWDLETVPDMVELRLIWFTKGKGDQDYGVVATEQFRSPRASEMRQFNFTLPTGPYSFSGRLISLIWALELVVYPEKEAHRVELVMSPSAGEILLPLQSKGKSESAFGVRFN
jgi:hypothetical protein